MTPEIKIEQGRLRGSVAKNIHGEKFFKFQGIPYAKPPLGKLRFRAPQPPEKWSGVLDATKVGDICYSSDPLKKRAIAGSENCLFLNVYTKKLPDATDTSLSPVLFWIHGGGFVSGSGNEDFYGPDFLITEDVVVVTINYRLGLLGFVIFEDPALDIPGNTGFKDQVLALKWVEKNISAFGGDPNNVTIFGQSAGAVSVHGLVLSPMGKELFHRAIVQSGGALLPAAQGVRNTKLLAKAMDLEGEDDETIYNTLMEKSVEEIFAIQKIILANDFTVIGERRPFGLVIEENSKEPFLVEEPLEIIRSGKFNHVPLIFGYTSAEGMFFDLFTKSGIIFENYVPWFFDYEPGTLELQIAGDKIKKFYFGNEEYSEKTISKKYDLVSDSFYLYGIYLGIINHIRVSKSPVYFYRMTVETNLNYFKQNWKIELPGVSHFDDVGYLFKTDRTPEIKPGSIEDISLRRFVNLWSSFAKFGDPTPISEADSDILGKVVWKPVTGPNLDYLELGRNLVPKLNPDSERIEFWKNLFAESPAGRKSE